MNERNQESADDVKSNEHAFLRELDSQCTTSIYPLICGLSFSIITNILRVETQVVNRNFVLGRIIERFGSQAFEKVGFAVRVILEGVEAFLRDSKDPSKITDFARKLDQVIDEQILSARQGIVSYYTTRIMRWIVDVFKGDRVFRFR